MTIKSFANRKELRFVITLGNGKFGSSENNQITLENYRATVEIDKAGGMMMGTLRAQIYGVKQSDMYSCLTFPYQPQKFANGEVIKMNTVDVYALDGSRETLIFSGNIVNAWGDFQSLPNVFLMIQAQSAYVNQLSPVPPRSYKGAIDVATAMGQIAKSMGYTFENNGVDIQLVDLYLANTGLEQAKSLARAAGIDLYLDDKILAITPPNVARATLIPEISKESGLVGYPRVDSYGVYFQTLFNPSITFGGRVRLVSDIIQAAGEWIVTNISYRLQSETPNGVWFADIRGNATGLAFTKNGK